MFLIPVKIHDDHYYSYNYKAIIYIVPNGAIDYLNKHNFFYCALQYVCNGYLIDYDIIKHYSIMLLDKKN